MQMTSPSGVSLGSCSWVSAQSSKSTLWTSPCCSLERLKIRFWENFQLISKLTTQNHQNAPNLVDGPVMEENPRGKNVSLTKHHLGHSKRHTGQRFLQPPRPHQFRVPFSKRVISQLEAKHTTVIVSCIHHNPKAKKICGSHVQNCLWFTCWKCPFWSTARLDCQRETNDTNQ